MAYSRRRSSASDNGQEAQMSSAWPTAASKICNKCPRGDLTTGKCLECNINFCIECLRTHGFANTNHTVSKFNRIEASQDSGLGYSQQVNPSQLLFSCNNPRGSSQEFIHRPPSPLFNCDNAVGFSPEWNPGSPFYNRPSLRRSQGVTLRQSANFNIDNAQRVAPELNGSPSPLFKIDTFIMCKAHQTASTIRCDTCQIYLCCTCLASHNIYHVLIQLDESQAATRTQLMPEYVRAERAIQQSANRIAAEGWAMQRQHDEVIEDIKNVFARITLAFEIRSSYFQCQANQSYYAHMNSLMGQMQVLGSRYAQLTSLNSGIGNQCGGSFNNIRLSIEPLVTEFRQIAAANHNFKPGHSGSVRFNHSEAILNKLIQEIKGFGEFHTILPSAPVISPVCRPVYAARSFINVRRRYPRIPRRYSGPGKDAGLLCRPWGICVNRWGEIIVADRSNHRIQMFNSRMNFIGQFGSAGRGIGEFNLPTGVCVSPHYDHIVVADKDNHRIQVFRREGDFVLTFGEAGKRPGQLSYPWDVACNTRGDILVADTRNHRLQLFNATGCFIMTIGLNTRSAWQKLDSPRGVCFTPSGQILVTDFNQHRICKYGGHNFSDIKVYGQEGCREGRFLRPQGIVCDDEGNVVVADGRNNRIQVLDAAMKPLYTMGGEGVLNLPCAVALSPLAQLVIVDFNSTSIRMYEYPVEVGRSRKVSPGQG